MHMDGHDTAYSKTIPKTNQKYSQFHPQNTEMCLRGLRCEYLCFRAQINIHFPSAQLGATTSIIGPHAHPLHDSHDADCWQQNNRPRYGPSPSEWLPGAATCHRTGAIHSGTARCRCCLTLLGHSLLLRPYTVWDRTAGV